MSQGETIAADYVVIGAGSAGCVIANRLSANPQNKVLLIEAGDDDRPWAAPRQWLSNLQIYIPSGFARLLGDPNVDWLYRSEPEPGLGGTEVNLPRGKVLGGSSSINGLMYVRGLRSDYDGWQQSGCRGWGWDDILPYFRKAERVIDGDAGLQGRDGPLDISFYNQSYSTGDRILEACEQAGIPIVPTVNGESVEGACYTQATIHRGMRNSAARAFVHPVRKRPNLRILTRTQVTGLRFEGTRCIGASAMRDGVPVTVEAGREVVLSAGAFGSPQLLLLSGIGATEHLAAHGIAVRRDAPAVGENLHDHWIAGTSYRLKPAAQSLNTLSRGLSLLAEVAKYAVMRQGLLANAAGMLTAFVRTNSALDLPNVQLFMAPATIDYMETARTGAMVLDREPGMMFGGNPMRPRSRGSVKLASSDPFAKPKILNNFLTDQADQITTIEMFALMRRIAEQSALSDLVSSELRPGLAVQDGEGILEHVRKTGMTAYHPVGTCRMGSDEQSVLTPDLKVRGFQGLRVADASIMPTLVSANTNAACIMIGEKASDIILADVG